MNTVFSALRSSPHQSTRRVSPLAKALSSALLLSGLLSAPALADDASSHWYRQPAISPDGQFVLFSAHGDIWRVPTAGGQAVALTHDAGWDGHPVWSRDGQQIAFASDRFGDLDIFVMNAQGGDLKRLTYHDADDFPSDFSPDGQQVLFSSARLDSKNSSYFPTSRLPELYQVPLSGGAPRMLFTNPAREARWSPDGSQLVYREEKAYENEWRQRDTSVFARDIWIYTPATGEHKKVTDNPGGDHAPVWSPDGSALYMQSELPGGSFNVRRVSLENGDSEMLSSHSLHPARGLSAADDGTLVYSWHGALYRLTPGNDPEPIAVYVPDAQLAGRVDPTPAPASVSEFAVSPDGKEIAFISRGEIFVSDAQFNTTVRVTNTAEQERSVSFSPDGRALLYAAEYASGWSIHETRLDDDNEPRFSAATAFKSQRLYAVEGGNAFQPAYSPNGEMIAFIENRDEIRVMQRDGSQARTVFPARFNYSYSDGDLDFHWSPDSAWVSASYSPRGLYFYRDIGIAPADGSAPPRDISVNGYSDSNPVWHSSGDFIYWQSDRYGERSHGSWGAEVDVVAGFLTEAGWRRFNLTEQERALLSDAEKAAEKGDKAGDDADKQDKDAKPSHDIAALLNLPPVSDKDTPITIEFDAVEYRTVRLTEHSSRLADAEITPDADALYYLAEAEGGYDLWRRNLHDDETSKVASLDAARANLSITGDGKSLVVLADGKLLRADVGDKIELKPVKIGGEIAVRADEERRYYFEHVWAQVKDKFYDPNFHGLDWDAMYDAYGVKVAAVSNHRDFAELMSELLGQLNASHTGMRYRPKGNADKDSTASLGAFFELEADGSWRIQEILPGGPLDGARIGLKPGDRIVAINGQALKANSNPYALMNRQAGQILRLTTMSGRKDARDVRVRAWSSAEESAALYQRWIERRRAIVEQRSEGRIGYVHIRSMNDAGFRQIFSELFGRNFDKEAVVIDTRFNGGGWLHDDLITLFNGERYFNMRQRDRIMKGAPEERWTKPSAVVMNEGNYSNAHMFPYAYKLFGLGPLVGMPVPGTATAVWWETLMSGDLVFGIPQMPMLDQNNEPLENQQLEPDLYQDNPPEAAARGDDRPLEVAVDALLETLNDAR